MKFCPNCQTPNPDEFTDCGECGSPLGQAGAVETDVEVPKSRGGLIVGIIILLALLGAGGVFGWMWWQEQQQRNELLEFAEPYHDARTTFAEFWECLVEDRSFEDLSPGNLMVFLGQAHPPKDEWDEGLTDVEDDLRSNIERCLAKLDAYAEELEGLSAPAAYEDELTAVLTTVAELSDGFKAYEADLAALKGRRKLNGLLKKEAVAWLEFANKGDKTKRASAVRYLSFLECSLNEPLTGDAIQGAWEVIRDTCTDRGEEWADATREKCAKTLTYDLKTEVSKEITEAVKLAIWENTNTLELTGCFLITDINRSKALEEEIGGALDAWRKTDASVETRYRAELGPPETWDD